MLFRATSLLFSLYRLCVSPVLHLFFGPTFGCRFVPTCSQYAREAIAVHGAWKGGWMTFFRISRCNPFARAGFDPVPHDIAGSCFNHIRVSGR